MHAGADADAVAGAPVVYLALLRCSSGQLFMCTCRYFESLMFLVEQAWWYYEVRTCNQAWKDASMRHMLAGQRRLFALHSQHVAQPSTNGQPQDSRSVAGGHRQHHTYTYACHPSLFLRVPPVPVLPKRPSCRTTSVTPMASAHTT